jgi:hypothetical protein
MAQNFKWFEQASLQNAVLPRRHFHNRLEQPPLLSRRLLEEQLARPARQAKHVDGVINRGRRGLLDAVDFAEQPILPPAHRRGRCRMEPRARRLRISLIGGQSIRLSCGAF